MPAPICTLRKLEPTPTTVSFTVSTRAPIETLQARLIHYGFLAVRFLLVAQVLLVLWTKWDSTMVHSNQATIPQWLSDTPTGQWAAMLANAAAVRYLVPICVFSMWILVRREYTEESLLVLRGLGVETTTSSSTYLSTATTRFIPTTSIQDIFIHEAFKGFEVRFYLAIVVEDEEDVVVVFPVRTPAYSPEIKLTRTRLYCRDE
ncbi:hypothetical protein BT63DRAFT_451406 [Microthyrium microscopicum]|uniref:Phosphatidylinositol N-acetylglucosaminyltransferase subunit H conserved domain-containing protein n=1 Tax=Microthyrium microscopicum TaxID=703497 RepID=A0A6A6UPI8_9PEZI|nr:hypothetical protein BT63DRAFT_451406 [Microthyrium microscopicum]